MTIYRDSSKSRKPIICGQHKDVTYITDSKFNLYMEKVTAGLVQKTKKMILFDTNKEMEQYIFDNCKVLLNKQT